jgi:hypothetical protein
VVDRSVVVVVVVEEEDERIALCILELKLLIPISFLLGKGNLNLLIKISSKITRLPSISLQKN